MRPFGGARRDEEKSRAIGAESTPSATSAGQWDPKNQRPELWNLYNARIHAGESIRVFRLFELDRDGRMVIYPRGEDSDLWICTMRRIASMYVRGDMLLADRTEFL